VKKKLKKTLAGYCDVGMIECWNYWPKM